MIFFCIIIWKSNRSKTKIANRLIQKNPDLEKSVYELTTKIFNAITNEDKFRVLIEDYKFRLPIASAILSLLYPDNFTIFDYRVCETLTDFKGLDNRTNFQNLWMNYSDYIDSVKATEPTHLSLRDKDRLLWGKSFYEQLKKDITVNFNIEMKKSIGITSKERSKIPAVFIDPALDEYRDKVMFPEKLAMANEMLKTAKLPPNKHRNS